MLTRFSVAFLVGDWAVFGWVRALLVGVEGAASAVVLLGVTAEGAAAGAFVAGTVLGLLVTWSATGSTCRCTGFVLLSELLANATAVLPPAMTTTAAITAHVCLVNIPVPSAGWCT